MRIRSSSSVNSFKQAVGSLLLIIASVCSSFAQNGQSELLGINGDGTSIQSTLVGTQLAYAHFNQFGGQLKFAMLTSNGWTEQVIGSGFGVGSSLALATSPAGVTQMAVINGGAGSLSLYTRGSNGAWSAELIQPSDVKGRASLYIGPSETLVAFSSNGAADLMLARKTGSSWSITTIDASADVVGRESSIGVGPNTYAAIAYFDETNLKLKVAFSLDRLNWAVETIDYPGAKFGRAPQLTWLPNSELSILAGDVIQSSTVGGQGLIHVQRSAAGLWSLEQVGFPAESSQSGKFIGSADNRNSALITRAAGVSSILNTQRAANGLWSGVTAFIAPTGESLSEITTASDSADLVNYFAKATIGTQTFVRRANGVVTIIDPTPPVTPTPAPTPAPTPEPRSGADADGDGLTDADEVALGTNPQSKDTDGDGVFDGQEVADQTNPTSANSFVGSVENRICSFWSRKKNISQRLEVSNFVTSTLEYNVEILTNAGQLKGVDQRNISAKVTSAFSLDAMIKNTGNLSRGQVCVRFTGKESFLTSKYFEVKAGSPVRRSSASRPATAYLLQHELTSGEKGNQELSFKTLSAKKGERVVSELNLQNISTDTVRGKITGMDARGKKTIVVSVTINPGALVAVTPAKLKLNTNGKIVWNPSVATSEVRAVYEQEVEKKVGKDYTVVKIARKDGNRK